MSRRIILPNWVKDLQIEVMSLKDQVEKIKKEKVLTNTPRPIPRTVEYELENSIRLIEKPVTPVINAKIKPRKTLPNIHSTNNSLQAIESVTNAKGHTRKSIHEQTISSSSKVLNCDNQIVSLENLKNHL